jgi:hypothetical protein
MATGGDIIEITFNHPSIGSGTLFPKAGEDSTYNTGGFRSADDDNMIDGAGNMIFHGMQTLRKTLKRLFCLHLILSWLTGPSPISTVQSTKEKESR